MCLQTDWQCIWLEELNHMWYAICMKLSFCFQTDMLQMVWCGIWVLVFFQSSPDDSHVQPDLRTFTQVSHRGSHA